MMARAKPGTPGDPAALPEAVRDGFVPWDVPPGDKIVNVGASRVSVSSHLVALPDYRKENRDRAKILWHRPSRKTWIVGECNGQVFSILIPEDKREFLATYCETRTKYTTESNRTLSALGDLRKELAARLADAEGAEFVPGPADPPAMT